MLFTEFNIEDAKQVWREEAFEEGKPETVRTMFAEGFNLETISRITEIALESLKEKLCVQ